MHYEHMFGTQLAQDFSLNRHEIGMKDAHELARRIGGVGERPQNVKHGAHTQLFAHRRNMLHGRMVVRRKHKPNAAAANRLGHLFGRQVNVDTEMLEKVCATRLRRDRAPPVLGHRRACGGGHKHGRGRNIKAVGVVAPRATHVDEVGNIGLHLGGEFAHHLGRSSEFGGGLDLHPQCGQECSHLHG